MGGLVQELKRRNVFKVGAAYAVVAFVLAQVAELVLPTFDAPAWVLQSIIFLFVLGFPIAVLLAWAFELTPGGIKADTGAGPAPVAANNTDRKLIYAILGLVVVGMGFQIVDRFASTGGSTSLPSQQGADTGNTASRVIRSRLDLGAMPAFRGEGLRTMLSLSPDGSMLAYTTIIDGDASAGNRQMHLLDLSQLESQLLEPPFARPSQTATTLPVISFSPDGRWVAYSDSDKLMKIPVSGGAPVEVVDGVMVTGNFWTQQDSLMVTTPGFGLARVSVEDGRTEQLTIAQEFDFEVLTSPYLLPDDKNLLFTRGDYSPSAAEPRLELYNLETGEIRVLLTGVYAVRYSNSGHLIFIRAGSLSAVPFDLETLQITGSEVALIDNIEGLSGLSSYSYALSESGDLVYLPGRQINLNPVPLSRLSWVDSNGEETVLDMEPQYFQGVSLSPNGSNVVLSIVERTAISDIYNYDLDRGTLARITFTRNSIVALWNVKGDRIVYGTLDGGIYSVNANGLGNTESLFSDPLNDSFPILTSFSPDGSELLYTQLPTLSKQEGKVFPLSMSPEGETRELFANDFFEAAASVSPDGRWIAYQSNESGSLQIHVRPYPANDTDRWQISIDGGSNPKCSADGTHLFYRKVLDAEGRMSAMYSVSLEAGEVFKAGQPSVLFTSCNHPLLNRRQK